MQHIGRMNTSLKPTKVFKSHTVVYMIYTFFIRIADLRSNALKCNFKLGTNEI